MKKSFLATVIKQNFLALLLLFIVLGVFFSAVRSAKDTQQGEGKKLVEQSITRAMVSCYAMEGFYPLSLDYLIENYGLVIDTEKYNVVYDAFASNFIPQVFVFEK